MGISIEKIDDYRWLIPKTGPMRVPGLIFSSTELMAASKADQSLTQVANVATLPGIVGQALGMPDIHWGYGFPIGGVAAFEGPIGQVDHALAFLAAFFRFHQSM